MIRKIITFLAISLFLFTSCSTDNGDGGGPTTPFIGGSTGLLSTFVEQAPPDEVFDGGDFPFDVEVNLNNLGETFVAKEDVRVKISGINPADFGKTAADLIGNPEDDLEPTYQDPDGGIIEGTETYALFSDLNHGGELSGNTQFTIRADVCYQYETIANALICIKEDLLDQSDTSVCVVSEDKTVYNSGAPVAVTAFREQASGADKVAFIFTVSETGSGEIFKLGVDCDDSLRSNENKVHVSVNSGITGLACSGLRDGDDTSGYITLHSGSRTVRCTQQLTDRTDYEKVLEITLGYDYNEFIDADLLVKHTGD
ncbi:hypothetical protein ACFLZX_00280 [Nanoarchaeota archaeon]